MLVVRREQVAAFRADVQRRFAERMRMSIAAAYPAHYEALGEEGTNRLIHKGILDGERYRLGDDAAVAGLIGLMVELGERLERFPERAWAERMLDDTEVPGEVRVKAVRARLLASTGGRRLAPPLPEKSLPTGA